LSALSEPVRGFFPATGKRFRINERVVGTGIHPLRRGAARGSGSVAQKRCLVLYFRK